MAVKYTTFSFKRVVAQLTPHITSIRSFIFGNIDPRTTGKPPVCLNKKRIQVAAGSKQFSVGILYYRRSLIEFARLYRNLLKAIVHEDGSIEGAIAPMSSIGQSATKIVGIGVALDMNREKKVFIRAVYAGSPADKAGLRMAM
jgi:hypothetical protein